MSHPAIVSGNVAVVTGGASGIGLAAAKRFASLGLRVCIVDRGAPRLARARDEIVTFASGPDAVMAEDVDVARRDELERLEEAVVARYGGVDVLMNNAGIGRESSILGPREAWEATLGTNLWGVVNGTQVFVPGMLARGKHGLVINTGSKQGITTPPGNPAYNVSKAGVKAFTEALEHELRNTPTRGESRLRAHLFIPGYVFTAMTAHGRTEKPAGAWTAEQTIDFLLARLEAGDFYILCPDNEVTRELDEKRILWAARDLIDNRPPLSRWHPDYAEAFARFVGG